jgi:CBS domain-containing protein
MNKAPKLLSAFEPNPSGVLMKVSDIMRVKGHALFTVAPSDALHRALATMAENDIGSVVVMEQGQLAGILTFREIIATVHGKPDAYRAMQVAQVMDSSPSVLAPDTELQAVLQAMLGSHARYMPVMEGAVLMGVISFYDVAKAVMESERFENEQLKAYIQDWPSSTFQA